MRRPRYRLHRGAGRYLMPRSDILGIWMSQMRRNIFAASADRRNSAAIPHTNVSRRDILATGTSTAVMAMAGPGTAAGAGPGTGPAEQRFDVIIVGGGSSGAVLAA